jgi:hypothetical protein
MAFRPMVFRPLSGRIIAVATAAICLIGLVVMFIVRGDPEYSTRTVGAVAFLAALSIAVFWMPKIDVREDAIEVRNVFSTARIPWGAIRSIETRWSLAFVTDRGKVTAWASPPPNRAIGADVFFRGFGALMPTGASGPAAPSRERDNVAEVIRDRWAELADREMLDPPNAGTGPDRTVHTVTILVLVGLLLLAALGAVL